MRLSPEETTFWYGCALRAAGLSAGAVPAAVAMIQWAEIRHGLGVAYFDRRGPGLRLDPGAMRLGADDAIDGGGQSSLLVGPALLDIATVAAKTHGRATITAVGIDDSGWLGQLAAVAAERGLVAVLGFAAEGSDAVDLARLYSARRTIAALPDGTAIEWDAAIALPGHEPARRGVTLTCVDPARHADFEAGILAAAADAAILSADDIEARTLDAMREGVEVDAAAWRRLADGAYGVLAESTERSLRGAGAE
jgi:hypothetical protein